MNARNERHIYNNIYNNIHLRYDNFAYIVAYFTSRYMTRFNVNVKIRIGEIVF